MLEVLIKAFLIALEVQGHTIPPWKALRYGKYNSRGISCGSTLNIYQDILKSGNLLHKQGFVDSQFGTTVNYGWICLHMTSGPLKYVFLLPPLESIGFHLPHN